MQVKYSLPDLQILKKTLKGLPPHIQRKVGLAALKESAKPIIKHYKASIPKRTGATRRSIKAIPSTRRDEISISIGPVSDKKNTGYKINFLKGTDERFVYSRKGKKLKKAASRGRMQRFVDPERILTAKIRRAIKDISTNSARGIDRYLSQRLRFMKKKGQI